MTKRTKSDPKKRRATRADDKSIEPSSGGESNWLSSAAMRETVESVIIAFVLAFLFRTFEAEAFVIPTGSMAPTLMGKHKDVQCPMCGYRYQANASDQNDKAVEVSSTACPMCHFTADVALGNPQGEDYPSYDGDRILVAKFPYEFEDPKRWDVVVFKYPGNAVQNYIKRLVGLPGETVRIRDGNLWIHKPDMPPGEFKIARKPPEKILAMLQPVYDNDYARTITGEMHWPARWTADDGPENAKWSEGKDLTSFQSPGAGKTESWVRYRNRVPTREAWNNVAEAAGMARMARDQWNSSQWMKALREYPPAESSVPPRLVSDFAAYNTSVPHSASTNGVEWVGDLAVQFDLESQSAGGSVAAELVKGGRHFQCRFDLASGTCAMSMSGDEQAATTFHPSAMTAVKGAGRHAVMFSNVDDQLRLWVDGSLVKFHDGHGDNDRGTADDSVTAFNSADVPDHIPNADDLQPVSVGAKSAAVRISHIKVFRDVYYIAVFKPDRPRPGEGMSPLTDFKTVVEENGSNLPNLADPANWDRDFSHGPEGNMKSVDIPLAPPDPAHPEKDQFFVLGDNSPQSQDGRLWCTDPNYHGKLEYWVDRRLFIGKALFIYWPHGWPIELGHIKLPLYINPIPNFRRMHLVR